MLGEVLPDSRGGHSHQEDGSPPEFVDITSWKETRWSEEIMKLNGRIPSPDPTEQCMSAEGYSQALLLRL
jgi:hypothetical protein